MKKGLCEWKDRMLCRSCILLMSGNVMVKSQSSFEHHWSLQVATRRSHYRDLFSATSGALSSHSRPLLLVASFSSHPLDLSLPFLVHVAHSQRSFFFFLRTFTTFTTSTTFSFYSSSLFLSPRPRLRCTVLELYRHQT